MKIKFFLILVISLTVLSCTNRSKPNGVYYGGPPLTPSVYYYVFSSDGTIKVSQGKGIEENCRTEGSWKQDKDGNLIISGLSNSNCYFMSDLNGKYLICDDPDCLPSGKAYIMGDVRIWPDKQ